MVVGDVVMHGFDFTDKGILDMKNAIGAELQKKLTDKNIRQVVLRSVAVLNG